MAKKKLDGYKGKLSLEQVVAGINAAIHNARRLAEDAKLLLEAKRFPSAAALAILSVEESGKTSILRSLVFAKDEKVLTTRWRDYRTHTKKNTSWILPQLVIDGARRLDDFKQLFDESSEHPFVLDNVKQISLYTDCLGNAHWSVPDEVVDELLATKIVEIAVIFSGVQETSLIQMELWVKHLAPVWMKDATLMKQATINWYAEMQELGIVPGGNNIMNEFIYGSNSEKE